MPEKIEQQSNIDPAPALQEILSELKPIHFPATDNGLFNLGLRWPPAPGHIALALILCIVITLLIKIITKKIILYIKSKPKYQALRSLNNIEIKLQKTNITKLDNNFIFIKIIQEISALLKKAAITKHKNIQHLSGEPWLHFLNTTGKTEEFTKGDGQIINTIIYKKSLSNHTASELEKKTKNLINLTKKWIKYNL